MSRTTELKKGKAMTKLLPRTNDLIFKKIFGDQKNKNILKDFLQSVLDLPAEEYDKIEIVDPHSRTSIFDDKECILDIKLHTKSKRIIDIEMQVRHSPVMKQRVVYYLADMVKEQLKNGDNYGKLQKVISIIIAAKHKLVMTDEEYFHKYHLHDKENNSTFTDLMEVNTLELQKLPKKSDNSKLWKWLRFLKTDSEEEMEMLTHGNNAIKEAVCVLKELSEDERTRLLVQSREKFRQDQEAREKEEFQKGKQQGIVEGIEKGKQQGIVEGMEKGIKSKSIEIAKSALKMGMSNEQIMHLTGLTLEEIKSLND